jgi:hypothetical protein
VRTYGELKQLIERRGVHTVFGEPGESNWFIEQNAHELATFLVAMQELGVQSVLEIGTGWRAGLARFLANDMGWRVVSMDKNQPVNPAPNVQFLMGRSEILRPLFDGQTFDLVIIDADHSYEAVKRDYEMYAALADKAVMFHDIAGLRDCEGAARFWNEIKSDLDGHEIIADGDQRSGIGWIDHVANPVVHLEDLGVGDLLLITESEEVDYPDGATKEELVEAIYDKWDAPEPIAVEDLDDAVHAPVPDYEEMTAPEPPKKTPRKRKPKAQ